MSKDIAIYDDVTVVWLWRRRDAESWRVVGKTGGEWTVTKTILGWRVRNWRGRELLTDRPPAARAIAAVQRFEADREGQA